MGMLVDDSYIESLDSYIEFIRALEWYRINSAFIPAESSIQENTEAIKHVRTAYFFVSLSYRNEADASHLRFEDLKLGHKLMVKLERVVKRIENGENVTQSIADAIGEFFAHDERRFRAAYVEWKEWQAGRGSYWPDLFRATAHLARVHDRNGMVSAAFVHLETLLRHVVGVKPHELHGEDLIARAFNSGTGILQLNTLPNEQQALRNMVAGAYGLFRNPTAHRWFFDATDSILHNEQGEPARQIVAFVDVIDTIVHNVYRINLSPKVHKVLADHAEFFDDERGRAPKPTGTNDDWEIARVRVWLDYSDEQGFSWMVRGEESDLPILRKIRAALSAETGIKAKASFENAQ